uniref:Putative HNH homing endonuclease n=1 Tax=Microglena monadina TaxID=47904 RepID=A0A0S2IC39_9CHLO|nr:putative HNH homing endonuclease [Microglena monadina]
MEKTHLNFEQGELDNLLENLKQEASQLKFESAYELFINKCRNKKYPDGIFLQKHHIIPVHMGGKNDTSNLVLISTRDHAIAHWLLWKLNDSKFDQIAYRFIVSTFTNEDKEKLHREINKIVVAKYKEQNRLFYNSEFQREQGLKGGQKGGLAGTEAQFLARQVVGKQWGPIVGKSNQNSTTIEFLSKFSLWSYEGCRNPDGSFILKNKGKTCPDETICEKFNVLVPPKDTFIAVLQVLESFAPGSIKKNAVLYKCLRLNYLSARYYGWRLLRTITRSEVEEGALDNLSVDFLTEEIIVD